MPVRHSEINACVAVGFENNHTDTCKEFVTAVPILIFLGQTVKIPNAGNVLPQLEGILLRYRVFVKWQVYSYYNRAGNEERKAEIQWE